MESEAQTESETQTDNSYYPFLIQSMIPTGMTGTYVWCIGPTGPTGPPQDNRVTTGMTGQVGPVGPSLYPKHPMTFIHVYSEIEQKIYTDEPFCFDTHSILSGHCAHLPNTPYIWFWKPGFYHITTSIFPVEAMQCSFLKNDADVDGGTFGTFNGLTELVGTFMIHITEDDFVYTVPIFDQMGCKLSLVNNTVYTPFITLHGHPSSNYDKPQTTVSVTIVCIG